MTHPRPRNPKATDSTPAFIDLLVWDLPIILSESAVDQCDFRLSSQGFKAIEWQAE